MAIKFLLDPRVLDDCVSDSVKDVEIVGEVVAYRKPRLSVPEYLFYVGDVDANKKPIIPPSLLEFFHRKKEMMFDSKHLISLHYQRANATFLPYLSKRVVSSPPSADKIDVELVFCKGQFLKGDAESFKNYGIKIL